MKINSLNQPDINTILKKAPDFQRELSAYISLNQCTLLAVGPVSVNCVDAAIELSGEYNIPMMLIASRRQVDSEAHGGGYVNNWTTPQFADYVQKKDQTGNIILARDHGGPWQNPVEIQHNYSLEQAMESAKASYRADIDAGFKVLHIDPSIDTHGTPDLDKILNRVFELYEYCANYAAQKNRKIVFEVGTEEQSGGIETNEDLDYLLKRIEAFCKNKNFHLPMFVVVQIGTKVMETKNIGQLESTLVKTVNNFHTHQKIKEIVEICNRADVHIKVHNGDYLSDEVLKLHPKLGIHAANVAPEFAVTETRALVSILEKESLNKLLDQFFELSYNSMRWVKWMMEESQASDRDRAIISGHYVFSTPEFHQIKQKIHYNVSKKNIDLDQVLKHQIKKKMMRYLRGFNLI